MSSDSASCTFSVAQVLQLGDDMELPDDICMAEVVLDDEKDIYFLHSYDVVMDRLTFRFLKRNEASEEVNGITLTTDIVNRILFIFPRLNNLAERYRGKDIICYHKYEIATDVFVTIGQIASKFGGKQFLDIRKQFRDINQKMYPTKMGIRFPLSLLPEMKGVLDASIEMSTTLCDLSGRILRLAKIALVEREIKALKKLDDKCYGCFVEHPSQKHHMGKGGCLEEKEWKVIVEEKFTEALAAVSQNSRTNLAKKIAEKMDEKGLYWENFVDMKPDEQ